MERPTRAKFIVTVVLSVAAGAALIWLVMPTRPDSAAAIRNRLMGENSRAVESLLGQPAYREHEDKTWHYLDRAIVGRFVDRSAAEQTLVVEFNQEDSVCNVYLAD
jgi:outer membrane protein assembly factor BamE (lipoprotein component of BamABCDE complex)